MLRCKPNGSAPAAAVACWGYAGEDGLVQFAQAIDLAGGRLDRGLTERDKHRGERRRRRVRPLPLEDRKLKIRQMWQAAFHAEDTKSADKRARRKRRDRETSQGSGADAGEAGARVDDLPGQVAFAKRDERCVARNRMLAVQGQR